MNMDLINCEKFMSNTKLFPEEFYPTFPYSIVIWTTLTGYI